MANIEGFRAYARLDEEDPSAEICYNAALAQVKIAGVPPMDGNGSYDLLIYALALYYYENRGFSPGMAVDGRTQTNWAERQITAFLIQLGIEARLHPEGSGASGNP